MNTEEIRKFCLALPQTTEKLQWGDALCFKVGGKMFAVLGLDHIRLSFKCTPETFAELIEREDVTPSPYLGRYKWVMLHRLDALPWNEMQGFIRHSHELVAANRPKKSARKLSQSTKAKAKTATDKRTVNPQTKKKVKKR
jgi:predicted DNA-binding protein (MmcQ/YjbR family)